MLEKLFNHNKSSQYNSREAIKKRVELDRYDRIFHGGGGYGFLDYELKTGRAYWRGGFWSHLGYKGEEIYDGDGVKRISTGESFIKYIHPDDQDAFRANITNIVKNDDTRELIFRIVRKDGRYLWVEMRLDAIRDKDDRAVYLSGVAFDISAIKEAQEALSVSKARHERIIRASNDGIWEWGSARLEGYSGDQGDYKPDDFKKGWFVRVFTSRCWDMIGFSEGDPEVKEGMRAWRRLMNQDDLQAFDVALRNHILKRSPVYEIEYRIQCKNGEWRWILARGQVTCDDEGYPVLISGTNVDITDLKHAEANVLRAKEEAEQANHAKSEFLSSMSHELRTPLNAILGFTQLLEYNTNLTPEQQGNLHEIKAAGKHLLELVGDALDLATIEAGSLKLCIEDVRPCQLMDECITLLKSQIKEHSLTIKINYNNFNAATIRVDKVRLKQIFINLLSNAIKYNKRHGHIHIECIMSSSGLLRMMVEDSGIGIPEKHHDALFQPFNRLGLEQSSIEGSGVGLVITKQLVEQMGGEIGFKSEEDARSQFWVEFSATFINIDDFPRLPSEVLKDSQADIPELLVSATKTVLYVEDNPSNQKLMEQVLAKFPVLDLTIVGLGVQGLFVARSSLPDLIILDVNLPGISGYEIVEILKQDEATAQIPVIALSANVMPHDIEKGKEAGFDYYLTKPLDLVEFVEVCNKFLAN